MQPSQPRPSLAQERLVQVAKLKNNEAVFTFLFCFKLFLSRARGRPQCFIYPNVGVISISAVAFGAQLMAVDGTLMSTFRCLRF